MKKNQLTFKNSFILSALVFIFIDSQAQSISRQTIAGAGTSSKAEGILIQSTSGQPYGTSAYYDDDMGIRPGFNQLSKFSLEPVSSTLLPSLKMFPNPAAYSVSIESSDPVSDVLITVSDMTGKFILNENVSELSTYLINCESWANGTYLITVSDKKDNSYKSKLIITK